MSNHRADRSRRSRSPFLRRAQPRHARTRLLPLVVAPAVGTLVVLVLGGILTATAPPEHAEVDMARAAPSVGPKADLLASRGAGTTSRSGSRVLLGADRIEAIEAKAQATTRALQRREARRSARQEARERAKRRRQSQIREARLWGAPLENYTITATFGQSSSLWSTVHTGVDLDADTGAPVRSVGPGTVTFAAYDGSYGYKIVVQHDDGTETWYCHLSQINVTTGSRVTHETIIGLVGATGNVTGDHLHLELRPAGGGQPVDPVAGLVSHGLRL